MISDQVKYRDAIRPFLGRLVSEAAWFTVIWRVCTGVYIETLKAKWPWQGQCASS